MRNEKVLLVVTPSVGSERLQQAISEADVKDADLRIVVPSIARSALSFWFTDQGGISRARSEAEAAQRVIGAAASRSVAAAGDSDPQLAVEDALAQFDADRIIVVHRSDHPGFREAKLDDIGERIHREVDERLVAA